MQNVKALAGRLGPRLTGIRRRLKVRTRVRRALGSRPPQNEPTSPFATVGGEPPDKSVSDLVDLFFALVEHLQPDLFVEAGAKEASASRRAYDLKIPRVVAFEASPVTHERFAHENDAIEYLNLALSDQPGTVSLNIRVDERGALRSDGRASLLQRTSTDNATAVRIAATTLDSFFADHEHQSAALWIDVEGATGQVLTGGRTVLSRASVVMVEVEDRSFWKDQWLVGQVLSFLHDCGLVPIARDHQSAHQFNVVLVRSTLVPEVQELVSARPSGGG